MKKLEANHVKEAKNLLFKEIIIALYGNKEGSMDVLTPLLRIKNDTFICQIVNKILCHQAFWEDRASRQLLIIFITQYNYAAAKYDKYEDNFELLYRLDIISHYIDEKENMKWIIAKLTNKYTIENMAHDQFHLTLRKEVTHGKH